MSRALLAVLAGVFLACAHGEPAIADAFDDALTARREGDFPKAFRLFHSLAEKGDPGAQYNLGYMYRSGEGTSRDAAEAAKWIELAANQGLAHAQYLYGVMCASGEREPRDYREAVKWFGLAANQNHAAAQFRLGGAYFVGFGVPQNYVLAHMWLSLSAAKGNKDAESKRNTVAHLMTPHQVAEARSLATEWTPGSTVVLKARPAQQSQSSQKTGVSELSSRTTAPKAGPEAPPQVTSPKAEASPKDDGKKVSGTAFFISGSGETLTNAHVVRECSSLRVYSANFGFVNAWVIAHDKWNDLALLGTDAHPAKWASWRFSARQGEDIVVYGFPLSGVLASNGNVVTGNITALAGLDNDSSRFQISAPLQPGNSGGPLFDRTGSVVGVAVAKLDAMRVASITGDIPQNVNFAIKGSLAMGFLESQRYAHKETGSAQTLSTPEITAQAHAITMQVFCVR